MLDEMLVQSVGDRRQGDGGTRVAVSRTLNRVGRQDLGHLDGALVQLVSLNSVMDYFPSNWSGRVSGLCRALDALTLRFP